MSNETVKLFDEVLFESDRTCCICRDKARPVQVHHIDGDHSNNDRANLSVVCDACHKLAHTTVPFSRNLTGEQVRLYDRSWRSICSKRLLGDSSQPEQEEYRQEVMLEVSLACHEWKNHYIDLYPGHFRKVAGDYTDVWDMLIDAGSHGNSQKEWSQYLPLFEAAIESVVANLRSILACHANALPGELKTLILRTVRQLRVERSAYSALWPKWTDIKSRVDGVLRTLRKLARSADSLGKASPVVHWRE